MMLSAETHLKGSSSVIDSVVLHVHIFFLLKNSRGLYFNAGCLLSMWQSNFEDVMASLLASWSPHIIQFSCVEYVNQLL